MNTFHSEGRIEDLQRAYAGLESKDLTSRGRLSSAIRDQILYGQDLSDSQQTWLFKAYAATNQTTSEASALNLILNDRSQKQEIRDAARFLLSRILG